MNEKCLFCGTHGISDEAFDYLNINVVEDEKLELVLGKNFFQIKRMK